MPLPFILAGVAVAAAGYGAKKGYDGYQDKSLANDIIEQSEKRYNSEKRSFDYEGENATKALDKLGSLQLKIGSEFKEFQTIADELLQKIDDRTSKDITISLPQHRLNAIKEVSISTTTYLSQVVGAGAAGAAAGYAVYGGVMALAAASTGTPIAALSGAAAYNATMAAIGGGAISAGGLGMAGGAYILGSVVGAPILAIAGYAFANYAKKALDNARAFRDEVDQAVEKIRTASKHLSKTKEYATKVHRHTDQIYKVFSEYLEKLKAMDVLIRSGFNLDSVSDDLLKVIDNGYQVAAILTDIITTPLFRPVTKLNGEVVLDKETGAVKLETDSNGMQVLNYVKLDKVLHQSVLNVAQFKA